MRSIWVIITAGSIAAALAGCGANAYKPDPKVHACVLEGSFGHARELLESKAPPKAKSRRYALDRLQRLTLANAEGVPGQADSLADQMYDFLRTQGVNDDKTAAAILIGGGNVRIWKGEPFEQASAYVQIAAHDAMQGEWGNARAAASNSLFLLRDFSEAIKNAPEPAAPAKGQPAEQPSTSDLVKNKQTLKTLSEENRKAKQKETAAGGSTGEAPGDDLGIPYQAVPSDFEIGYVLKAIASRQMRSVEEARESLAALCKLSPRLAGFASQIEQGQYNTVLVVEYGLAPKKVGAGYLNSYTEFQAVTPSDDAPLVVHAGGQTLIFPVVTDLNSKTSDLKWHAEEDLSLARAYIGTGVAVTGAALAASSSDTGTQIVGLVMMLGGGYLMATAAADTTHCELLAQRTYVALLNVSQGSAPVQVMVEGRPESQVTLSGLGPAPPGDIQLRYIRLPMQACAWTQGQVLYSNIRTGPAPGSQLPFILGGVDVSPPTRDRMSIYHAAGLPTDVDLSALLSIYRAEGISVEGIDSPADLRLHVLEGGTSLYTPLGGTVGFARLFGQVHPPYQPKSAELGVLVERMRGGAPGAGGVQ